MTPNTLLAASLFAVVSSITPGPNNMMILASGVNFGFARSLRHLFGITLGFGLMVLLVGLGLHTVLDRWPVIYSTMRWAGAAYLLWLAWKLANAGPPSATASRATQPMGFFAAAAFQWVNPKAWVMAVTAISTFLPAQAQPPHVFALAALFMALNLPCVATWGAFGSAMRRVLQEPKKLRLFNMLMALALVGSLIPMLT
ncbi:LysE family translocator [Hydrogenophaga sp. PAMC20947]|uniref:LysE family translocator n=1 Tax=Hydrogenophaga sp. PAMC20947 TaxID=2565558 RepID=UPI00109E2600|nr:LysE family translocator [Hydrogenophaga sp. PAMC20947]QCB48017.1 LysE family translocator [Hydrogenophaga sp. PAMC20947]